MSPGVTILAGGEGVSCIFLSCSSYFPDSTDTLKLCIVLKNKSKAFNVFSVFPFLVH